VRIIIDRASIRNAVSALERGKEWREWTKWDSYALSQATLTLMLCPCINLTFAVDKYRGPFADALRILSDEPRWGLGPSPELSLGDSKAGLARVKKEIVERPETFRGALAAVRSDSDNFHPWIDWVIRTNWVETVRQEGSLLDNRFVEELGPLLGAPVQEIKRMLTKCSSESYVTGIVGDHLNPPPDEIVQAFMMSVLLRGRLIEERSSIVDGQYAFHPLREPALTPITEPQLDGTNIPESALRLATIIVSSALQQPSPERRASSWASNIALVRRLLHYEQCLPFDDGKSGGSAIDEAVGIVKDFNLNVEWPTAKKYLDLMFEGLFGESISFVSLVVGIPSLVFNVGWRTIVKLGPGWKQIPENLAEAINKNNIRLRTLAQISERGPGKIFIGRGVAK
jgi:hypothetical protein